MRPEPVERCLGPKKVPARAVWRTAGRSPSSIRQLAEFPAKRSRRMSVCQWMHIVSEIEHESDPAKIEELAKELNDAMLAEQTERVKRRLGIFRRRDGKLVRLLQSGSLLLLFLFRCLVFVSR